MIPKIMATVPSGSPPAWAFLQRRLIETMSQAVREFHAKYTRPDGSLIWRETWYGGRDGVDDFYESGINWALLYLLGGDDDLLPLAQKHWEAITRQMTALGIVHKEYELGYDQFHQSEHYIYFYALCLADPNYAANVERAKRFAGFYLNEDPDAQNYDPIHKIIRAPHNGSGGPRWGAFDAGDTISWGYSEGMKPYGLPFDDIPGAAQYSNLKNPEVAKRMGEAAHERFGKGDTAANLGVCSLIANAWLLTHEQKYADWLLEYIGAWRERAAANGGLLPDNVGLNGIVGEYLHGRWYGGLYGWQFPHGFYNIGMAAIVAAQALVLTSGDQSWIDLPRALVDMVFSKGHYRRMSDVAATCSLSAHWIGQYRASGNDPDAEMFVVPYRHGDHGWFDVQPLSPVYPTALWALSQADEDQQRVENLRRAERYDWRTLVPFHNKEDSGHEQPWLRYLAGENPDYPEQMLAASHGQVLRRLDLVRGDQADLSKVSIHHWQQLNPVTTEALVQLTLGAPQPIYNGGLLIALLRYFDAQRRRPGLPRDVAALVEQVSAESIRVRLVNLSGFEEREVILQAGAFGEHTFVEARYDAISSDYPGAQTAYAAPPLQTKEEHIEVNGRYLAVGLPAGCEITLTLTMQRYAQQAGYGMPW